MKKIYSANIVTPKQVIVENDRDGEVVCCCGTQFEYNVSNNMANWHGFVVPVCPDCETVPASETRRMDL